MSRFVFTAFAQFQIRPVVFALPHDSTTFLECTFLVDRPMNSIVSLYFFDLLYFLTINLVKWVVLHNLPRSSVSV